MAFITWSEKLETGIDNIDKQHRRWVGMINKLDVAVKEGREEEALKQTLDELLEYTQYHFKTEESLMRQAKYDEDDFALHCREHRVFTDQIVIYRDWLAIGKMKITPQVMNYLSGWLIMHVTATDRGYIDPLVEAGLG